MIENQAVNALRILSADSVEKAKSGHPGLPLGAAPMAYELWANHMRHNPKNPDWINRDRFILSAGHGSALLYSLLHLFGYGNLSIEDLKDFRQLNSKTPGHPEYKHTIGVEATTGPLGAGLGMGVGLAIAETYMAAKFNKESYNVFDHYTYVLCGDGCLMEGISSEVLSLAGTLNLSKLIVLYDSNSITIEGSTELAFTEDVSKRMEAFGFQVLTVHNGTSLSDIGKAIECAKKDKRPSFIKITTTIGYGVPGKEGHHSAHGEPLGEANIKLLRETLKWQSYTPFEVPNEVYEHYKSLAKKGFDLEQEWIKMFEGYKSEHTSLANVLESCYKNEFMTTLSLDDYLSSKGEDNATRIHSSKILNYLKDIQINLIGGSADLSPSNKSEMSNESYYSKDNREGRNIHFGVRELGMTAITNGIALYGGLKAYAATFCVFSDYMKPMLRLAALMKLPTISILTHDSIGVGEDGPTHEPIEQIAMLRATPNINVFRPADETETKVAWYSALTSKETPTCLLLSRQVLKNLKNTSKEALKGGYIIEKEHNKNIDVILMASGSELSLIVDAKEILEKENISVRVVSMPCLDLFESQSKEYKESVLPKSVRKRVAVEAGVSMPWGKYVGTDGDFITIDEFGASAPSKELFDKYGFTVENIVSKVKNMLS